MALRLRTRLSVGGLRSDGAALVGSSHAALPPHAGASVPHERRGIALQDLALSVGAAIWAREQRPALVPPLGLLPLLC